AAAAMSASSALSSALMSVWLSFTARSIFVSVCRGARGHEGCSAPERKTRASPASAGFPNQQSFEAWESGRLGDGAFKRLRGSVLQIFERDLELADQRAERRRLVDGHVGQHLAIDLDAGLVEAVDETAVGDPLLVHRRIDALDPQRAERALAVLA